MFSVGVPGGGVRRSAVSNDPRLSEKSPVAKPVKTARAASPGSVPALSSRFGCWPAVGSTGVGVELGLATTSILASISFAPPTVKRTPMLLNGPCRVGSVPGFCAFTSCSSTIAVAKVARHGSPYPAQLPEAAAGVVLAASDVMGEPGVLGRATGATGLLAQPTAVTATATAPVQRRPKVTSLACTRRRQLASATSASAACRDLGWQGVGQVGAATVLDCRGWRHGRRGG